MKVKRQKNIKSKEGKRQGQDMNTERKRKSDGNDEKAGIDNNLLSTDMVLKRWLSFFFLIQTLKCTYVDQRNINFLGGA